MSELLMSSPLANSTSETMELHETTTSSSNSPTVPSTPNLSTTFNASEEYGEDGFEQMGYLKEESFFDAAADELYAANNARDLSSDDDSWWAMYTEEYMENNTLAGTESSNTESSNEDIDHVDQDVDSEPDAHNIQALDYFVPHRKGTYAWIDEVYFLANNQEMVHGTVTPPPMIGIHVRSPSNYGRYLNKRNSPFVRICQQDLIDTNPSIVEVFRGWLLERRGIRVSQARFGRSDWNLLCHSRFHRYRCRPSKLRMGWSMMRGMNRRGATERAERAEPADALILA